MDNNNEMSLAEWDAMQEVIRTHPDSLKAVEQLERVTKIIEQWTDGLLLATEATSEVERILR